MKKKTFILVGIAAVIILATVATVTALTLSNNKDDAKAGAISKVANEKGITITKNSVTSKAQFMAYTTPSGVKMEVVAVRAPDGTIRTAFNTCQVCFSSGRGYYVQVNDELVCQNCGNRFKISRVEVEKNGCNPVPIVSGEKEDNADTIVIPENFLVQNSNLFANWKTR